MWQDYLIALVVMVFTLSVIPMITQKNTPPIATALAMSVGALILAIVYATLGLWFSLAVETLATILWGILLWRGYVARQIELAFEEGGWATN
jgi:hypothetical protein